MSTFDVGTNVLVIGLLSDANGVTITNVAGDILYYADNNQVSPSQNQGTLGAGASITFGETAYVVSARKTSISLAYTFPLAEGTPGPPGPPGPQGPAGTGTASFASTGPGGVAGAFTGSAFTIPAPSGTSPFSLFWGVMNQSLVTVTMPAPVAGVNFRLRLDQDASGSRQLTFVATPTVNDPSGVLNIQSGICQGIVSTAFQTNWIRFESDGLAWYAFPDTSGPPTTDYQYQMRASMGLDVLPSAMAASSVSLNSGNVPTGLVTVDTSYTPVAGDPILLTAQATGANNGLWLAQTGVWTRPSAYPTGGTFRVRMCMVAAGTANSGWWWSANTTSKTIDTDSTTWVKKV